MLEEKLIKWITDISTEGELPQSCCAIYIGLFENETGYMIHFMGSVEFDPDEDDWACEKDNNYFPRNRYFKTGISTETEWKKFQNEVVAIVRRLKNNKKLILSQIEHIAVGFDNGSLEYV